MYHPAAALHQPSLKSTIITDFSNLPKAIEQAKRINPRNEASEKIEKTEVQTQSKIEPPAEQLSLF
jgi:DNA polymerase